MKRMAFTVCTLLLAATFAFGQEGESKKRIKIITTDEDGKEEVREFELADKIITWESEHDSDMKIIVRGADGETEEVIIGNLPSQMRWHMDADDNKAFLGVVMGRETDNSGVAIKKVTTDSPAEKAGLKAGDVIVAINDQRIEGSADLIEVLSQYEVDDQVTLRYVRDGKTKKASVTLANRSRDMYFSMPDVNKEIIIDLDDIGLEEMMSDDSDKAFLGIEPAREVDDINGVMILQTVEGSAAEAAGMQTGDVITAINGTPIANFDDLKAALKSKKPGDEVNVDYLRMGKKKSKTLVLTSRFGAYKSHKKVIIEDFMED
jgi:S1-C subfamily serine protease